MRADGHIAIVGAGFVGTSWALVFAHAGHEVRLFDADERTRSLAAEQIRSSLEQMRGAGLLVEEVARIAGRCSVVETLEEAVQDAAYVQESVREDLAIKTDVCRAIDKVLAPETFVGSSTSGFPASVFTEGLKARDRFLVVHPVNPPHLVRAVEIVPAPWTDPRVVEDVRGLMDRIGQRPLVLTREIDGFILNRLQGALLDEALRLYQAGYASVEDIDTTVKEGLGARWCFMGPFETIDLNARDGLVDYAAHLSGMYRRIAESRPHLDPWDKDAVQRAHKERRLLLPREDFEARKAWRDAELLRRRAEGARR